MKCVGFCVARRSYLLRSPVIEDPRWTQIPHTVYTYIPGTPLWMNIKIRPLVLITVTMIPGTAYSPQMGVWWSKPTITITAFSAVEKNTPRAIKKASQIEGARRKTGNDLHSFLVKQMKNKPLRVDLWTKLQKNKHFFFNHTYLYFTWFYYNPPIWVSRKGRDLFFCVRLVRCGKKKKQNPATYRSQLITTTVVDELVADF